MVKVRVHPRFVIPYYAFYLEGLGRVFGFDALAFEAGDLPERTEYDDGFAFRVERPGPGTGSASRIYVSSNDFARYDRVALDWCDRYGMVNHEPALCAAVPGCSKVVPIGPSFGVRTWGGTLQTLRDVARIVRATHAPPRETLGRLRWTWKKLRERLPEEGYVPGPAREGYVFFVSWPWKKHPEVNPPRGRFVRACRAARGVEFEGGFVPRRRRDVPGIEDVLARRAYPFREWIWKTKASSVVFNCPAVHQCFGWKLGEFLALGKAIVTLPLSRTMPAPLLHGEHVHYVEDSEESMRAAVEKIVHDPDYRTRLERGARRYYSEHLAPERVIQSLTGDR